MKGQLNKIDYFGLWRQARGSPLFGGVSIALALAMVRIADQDMGNDGEFKVSSSGFPSTACIVHALHSIEKPKSFMGANVGWSTWYFCSSNCEEMTSLRILCSMLVIFISHRIRRIFVPTIVDRQDRQQPKNGKTRGKDRDTDKAGVVCSRKSRGSTRCNGSYALGRRDVDT